MSTRHVLPGGALALVHSDRRHISVLNRTAHMLWRLRQRGGDKACLARALVSRFGLDHSAAESDVESIWGKWRASGLVDEARPGPREPTPDRLPIETASCRTTFRVGPLAVEALVSPSLAKLLSDAWSHLPSHEGRGALQVLFEATGQGRGRLVVEGRVLLDDAEPEVLLGAFHQTLIEKMRPGIRFLAMMHASSVALNGRAAILAAPSGSGKSTLTAYLAAHGFDYLSDDLAPLRAEDGHLVPFPMPISVKPGARHVLAAFYPDLRTESAGTLHLPQGADFLLAPLPVRALIFPRYAAGAETSLAPIGVADALARLLADRIFFGWPIRPAIFASFIHWLRGVERRVLIYSDLAEASREVRGLLA